MKAILMALVVVIGFTFIGCEKKEEKKAVIPTEQVEKEAEEKAAEAKEEAEKTVEDVEEEDLGD